MDNKLTAKIERYVYRNDENSYSIARVLDKDNQQLTIVGYIPLLSEDIYYDFLGSWINHERYGKQFKVESYSQSGEQTKEGIMSYLSSSFFTGVGPKTAEKIVNLLGDNAIDKIIENKNILKQLSFTNERIERLHQQLIQNQTNQHILVVLYGYNIQGKTAMKILNAYGIATLEKLEEDPYRLIDDIEGIGFIKADEIAFKLKIAKDDPRRIKAAILFSMNNYSFLKGDIYLEKTNLIKHTYQILGFEYNLEPIIDNLVDEEKIILEDDRYYLFSLYETEISVAKEIIRLSHNEKTLTTDDIDHYETLINMVQIQKGINYTKMQEKAILTSLTSKFSVITGGPGTGKTTIIDGLISVYSSFNKINLKDEYIEEEIALMAPTGRAAKRMEEVLGLKASTIHRALGYGYDGFFSYDYNNKMPQKLIIIDEASMIDIFLAKRLFEAINDNAKIIIVGDVDQLPSVSPGAVLKDIIESNTIPVVRLSEIHRQAEDSSIINLAINVNNQNLNNYDLVTNNDLYLSKVEPSKIKDILLRQVEGALKQGYSMVEDIQVLLPIYKGDIGIDEMNNAMQEKFNDTSNDNISYGDKKYYVGDKVIQLVNDPKNFIMNGDIGYVKRIGLSNNNKQYLVVNYDGNEVSYEKDDLDQINLAYAVSIHKSQGSEYKVVILPIVKAHMYMLKKELLYTAITRAKDILIILGDIDLLVYAANNLAESRKTTLRERIIKLTYEEEKDIS